MLKKNDSAETDTFHKRSIWDSASMKCTQTNFCRLGIFRVHWTLRNLWEFPQNSAQNSVNFPCHIRTHTKLFLDVENMKIKIEIVS